MGDTKMTSISFPGRLISTTDLTQFDLSRSDHIRIVPDH